MSNGTEAQHQGQRAYFDKAYSAYSGYQLENWRRSYIRRIFPELRLGPGKAKAAFKFLDVGIGGSGYTVIEGARLGASTWGVDLSESGVASARRMAADALPTEAQKRCHFECCPAEKLPFKDATFDAVSSIAVLEHVVEHEQAMAEIGRVLKPGGRAYVAVPHTYVKTPFLLGILNRINDRVVGHLRHYSADDLKNSFEGQGLQVVKVIYHAHSIKLLQFLLEKLRPAMKEPDSQVWWDLEQKDFDAWQDEHASMISVVVEKPMAKTAKRAKARR